MISEETSIKTENQQKEYGEAFFLHRDWSKRPQSAPRPNYFSAPQNPRFTQNNRWRTYSGGFSGSRSLNQVDRGGFATPKHQGQQAHYVANQRSTTPTSYQPRYRSRGPNRPRSDRCNFCGLNGHFERECDLRFILDRMKD